MYREACKGCSDRKRTRTDKGGRLGKRGSEGSVRHTLTCGERNANLPGDPCGFGLSSKWEGFLHVALDVA